MTSLAKTLTSKHLMAAFAISHMCLHTWRKGTPTKDPLPTVETDTRAVLFKPQAVKSWAKKNGVEIADPSYLDPATEIKVARGPKKAAPAKKPAAKRKADKTVAPKRKPRVAVDAAA